MTTYKPCDGCTLCCRLLFIPATNSAAGQWCSECSNKSPIGCKIQYNKPASCRTFQCSWTDPETKMPEHFRPDKLHVMFWKGEGRFVLMVDPVYPKAWKHPEIAAMINRITLGGDPVTIVCGNKQTTIPAISIEEKWKQ